MEKVRNGSSTGQLWAISAVLSLATFFLTKDFPFFWDTVQLASKQATYFYHHSGWLLPDEIDSGHPPGFGLYLNGWWEILGRQLWVSHLAMAPLHFLLFYNLLRFCRTLAPRNWKYILPFVAVEPVLLGQLCLVSPDVALLAFLLLLINAVMGRHRLVAFVAILALSVISTRAWMMVIAVFLFQVVTEWKSFSIRAFLPYFLGSVPAQVYLLTHYLAKGWVGYHPDSPWAELLTVVPFPEMIYNVGLLGWRLLDYGRVSLWLAGAVYILRHRNQLKKLVLAHRISLLLFALTLLLVCLAIIPRHGIVGPRYLLPSIIFFNVFVSSLLVKEIHKTRLAKAIYAGVLLTLFSGNFWVYPFPVAQAWDATPLHVPYYAQERNALAWLRTNDIALSSVGTVFPSIGPVDNRLLNDQPTGFEKYDGTQNYLFVSIIHNDWTDHDLSVMDEHYEIVAEWKSLGVFSRIYRRVP